MKNILLLINKKEYQKIKKIDEHFDIFKKSLDIEFEKYQIDTKYFPIIFLLCTQGLLAHVLRNIC